MSRGRKIALAIGVLALLLVLVGAVRFVLPLRAGVAVGSGMLAKQMCSCLYIAGRSQADCRADQFPVMDRIRVELQPAEQRVWAGLRGLGSRTAVHREGFGCTLE